MAKERLKSAVEKRREKPRSSINRMIQTGHSCQTKLAQLRSGSPEHPLDSRCLPTPFLKCVIERERGESVAATRGDALPKVSPPLLWPVAQRASEARELNVRVGCSPGIAVSKDGASSPGNVVEDCVSAVLLMLILAAVLFEVGNHLVHPRCELCLRIAAIKLGGIVAAALRVAPVVHAVVGVTNGTQEGGWRLWGTLKLRDLTVLACFCKVSYFAVSANLLSPIVAKIFQVAVNEASGHIAQFINFSISSGAAHVLAILEVEPAMVRRCGEEVSKRK
ncbi:hypothetical protein HBH53_246410 [Parastagonospora nodorum]|nr:hypothetical protein HBH53_246410 [Parastagonospora nodorum]KAH5993317.1 hypothetical protein HBI83_250300 [Parastagonospora nodorum]KAH6384394.1 hypothetical protein HBI60_244510 [Parastagonospora nodorum]